jgi:hypothetical protein
MVRVFWCALCRRRLPLSLSITRSWDEYFSLTDDTDAKTVHLCHTCATIYDADPEATQQAIRHQSQRRFYLGVAIVLVLAAALGGMFFLMQ